MAKCSKIFFAHLFLSILFYPQKLKFILVDKYEFNSKNIKN